MVNKLFEQVLKIDLKQFNAYNAGLLQGKAYRALNTELTKALLQFDLSIPEWKLLGQLYDHGEMKLAELADRLQVEAPLVTALIDKLEKKKLVLRKFHPHDKRAKIIIATSTAKKIIPKVEPVVRKSMTTLMKGVSFNELRTYVKVLKIIVTNASK